MIQVAVSKCRSCGRLNYVLEGPDGPECVCDCGRIFHVKEESIAWERPIAMPPRYAMTREMKE